MSLSVYLSGEIHTDWRNQITEQSSGLDAVFTGPVTDHAASDDCGVRILGEEPDKFWHDNKGANVNAVEAKKSTALHMAAAENRLSTLTALLENGDMPRGPRRRRRRRLCLNMRRA